jgi:hypothetical protein
MKIKVVNSGKQKLIILKTMAFKLTPTLVQLVLERKTAGQLYIAFHAEKRTDSRDFLGFLFPSLFSHTLL